MPRSSCNTAAKPLQANPVDSSGRALNAASMEPTNLTGCWRAMLSKPHLWRFIYRTTTFKLLQYLIRGASDRRRNAWTHTANSALVNTNPRNCSKNRSVCVVHCNVAKAILIFALQTMNVNGFDTVNVHTLMCKHQPR